MPLRRPLLRRLRLPFRHECIEAAWCWLEDSNPPPLAYKASALPDELSQLGKLTKRRGAVPDAENERAECAGITAPRPYLDVHNVKERGATGTVSQTQAKPVSRACAHTRAPKALARFSDVLRVVLPAICPSCLFGGGE
jgi:hypothetical protein